MPPHSENDPKHWPFTDPRVDGVREHYARVKFFLELAESRPDRIGKFRLLLREYILHVV